MDKLLVALISLSGVGFTYWFFLMKKENEAVRVTANTIEIIVDGGYKPDVIEVEKGKQTTLNFFRKDPSSCLEEVNLPEFKIRKFLPLKETVAIQITPEKEGIYEISCGMNMFHGKILVK